LGEGTLQKTTILHFFYRSGKVYTRCVEHSSIPHLGDQLALVKKEVFIFFPKNFWKLG
jgi:hypothetical protein